MPMNWARQKSVCPHSTFAFQLIISHFFPFFHSFTSLKPQQYCKYFVNKRKIVQIAFDTWGFVLYNMVNHKIAAGSVRVGRPFAFPHWKR